ncbi:MAG: LPS export ABC transporter periplasmic protein LptC [Bacteroidota bacterium]|nr:LPS export ABC transporter periplasmic protein LptC [Bacteroidota bacterium]MDP4212905.1 LPS export ABC transporter periplasmic protein LptC [Bacteroidota bacterium]MDP4249891.1 LPS export ABC transporter periplasmic protein LptC [Bacteroidota bacterium]
MLAACENNMKDLPNFRQKHFGVDEGKQITAYMSESAKVKARLTAPYMRRNEVDSPYVEFPQSLHVDFYNDSMTIASVMDARYGKWLELQSKVLLRDSVVVKNTLKGDTLYCQELWWDQKSEKFYTTKRVQIHKAGGTVLYGTGLEAPQDLSGYTIYQITGPFAFPENGMPKN